MSTIKVDTLQTVAGDQLTPARAWVNFNGTSTVAIRESQNVSSITDVSTGVYSVNFSPIMTSANYAEAGIAKDYGAVNTTRVISGADTDLNTSSLSRFKTLPLNTSAGHVNGADSEFITLTVHQ